MRWITREKARGDRLFSLFLFFFDEPKVYFRHIGGEGPAEQLAKGVRRALDRVKEVRTRAAAPADAPFDAQK